MTPTGAAMVSTLASSFGPMPSMKVQRIGYGAGENDFPRHPNVARLFVGERDGRSEGRARAAGRRAGLHHRSQPGRYEPATLRLFCRPGAGRGRARCDLQSHSDEKEPAGHRSEHRLRAGESDALSQLLFEQTTTIGLRIYEARRKILERETVEVETPYGTVKMKVARQRRTSDERRAGIRRLPEAGGGKIRAA